MYKRIIYILCALLICLSSITAVFADDDDGMDNYKIVDVYVANEKETEYEEIQFAKDSMVYSDLSEDGNRMINILSSLDIAGAFGDEELFLPDEPIKRCELVSLAMSLINADSSLKNNKIYFSDVSEDNKYFDDIMVAASLGIVGGYEDGTFCPDKGISYNEAIAVLTKALGYSVAAEIKGGWSAGYGVIAGRIGLTDGIRVRNGESLSRGESLMLLYNALDCPVFREKSIGDTITYESDRTKTALSEYHDIYNAEGRLNATFVSALPGYTETDNTTIVVGDEQYTVKKNDYVEYLGYDVEIYYKDNKEINKEIVFLAPQKGIKKTVIKADDITQFKNLTYYYGDGKKAHIAPSHSLIVNGVRITNYTESRFIPENGDVVLIANKGTSYDTVIINTFHSFLLKSISTNRDEEIVFESQYNLPSFMVKSDDEDQAFVMYLDDRKIETYAKAQTVYNADGFAINQIVIPDIPQDSVLNIFADRYDTILGKKVPSQDAKFVKIVISTQKALGKASSYNDEEIIIDNEDGTTCCKISAENVLDKNKISYKLDISGYYLFDYDGKIFAFTLYDGENQYIMADSGKKILVNAKNPDIGLVYGYLIKTTMIPSAFDQKLSAKILASDGSINIYPFADKVTFNGDRLSDHNEINSRLEASARMLNPKFTISQLVKYETNKDNKIIGIETVLQSLGLPDGADRDHLRLEHEKAQFSSRSEFGWNLWLSDGKNSSLPLYNGETRQYFKVPSYESFDDNDYSVPGTWWPNNTVKTVEIFDCDKMLVPSVVVQYDDPKAEYTYPYVMVKNVARGFDDKGNPADVLYFVGLAGDPILDNPYTIKERSTKPGEEEDTMGGEARFFAETDGLFDGLKCGDLIKIYGSNRYISKWEMVMSLDNAKKFDISRYPMKVSDVRQKWDMYEVYSVIEGDKPILMVQRGEEIGDGKREYMQLNPFEGTNGIILYDESGREPEITYWDNPHLLKQARKDGIEKASRVYIWETNVVMKLLVGYIGIQ